MVLSALPHRAGLARVPRLEPHLPVPRWCSCRFPSRPRTPPRAQGAQHDDGNCPRTLFSKMCSHLANEGCADRYGVVDASVCPCRTAACVSPRDVTSPRRGEDSVIKRPGRESGPSEGSYSCSQSCGAAGSRRPWAVEGFCPPVFSYPTPRHIPARVWSNAQTVVSDRPKDPRRKLPPPRAKR